MTDRRTIQTPITTDRLIIRRFTDDDAAAVATLSADWAEQPGPAFDKWPTAPEACRELAGFFAGDDRYLAITLRDGSGVVGLIALNAVDENARLDLGHVVHSSIQDDDIDREAIGSVVDAIFESLEVPAIVTHNADHEAQLAPLRSLGFARIRGANPGELELTRSAWRLRNT